MLTNILAIKSLILTLIMISHGFDATKSSPIEVAIMMPNKNPKSWKDLLIKVQVKSNEDVILLPKDMFYGWMDDSTGFLSIHLQKRKNGIYTEVRKHNLIDGIPFLNEYDTLQRDRTKEDEFFLSNYYHIYKGSYRVRVLGIYSLHKQWKGENSNWVYFQCKEDLYKSYSKAIGR